MTVIVALKRGSVWCMGSDSRHTWNTTYLDGDEPKYSQRGSILMGAAGAAWVNTQVKGALGLAKVDSAEGALRLLCDVVERHSEAHGTEENDCRTQSASIYAGPDGVAYLCSSGAISKAPDGVLLAIGCGGDAAEGAARALQAAGLSMSLEEICYAAMQAACSVDAMCGGTLWVKTING